MKKRKGYGSFHPRKLDLRQIILLSRIAILLLKGYFKREKIILHEKNLKHKKIILLINFIFDPTFFLIASYLNFKIIILLFLKAKLSIFAKGLIFVAQLPE